MEAPPRYELMRNGAVGGVEMPTTVGNPPTGPASGLRAVRWKGVQRFVNSKMDYLAALI